MEHISTNLTAGLYQNYEYVVGCHSLCQSFQFSLYSPEKPSPTIFNLNSFFQIYLPTQGIKKKKESPRGVVMIWKIINS